MQGIAQQGGLDSLQPPYSRSDLALIRQAINQGWPVDAKVRRLVADGVLGTAEAEDIYDRTRRSARQTLVLMHNRTWLG